MHTHAQAPPLPSHVIYQGDVISHQGQSESQGFPDILLNGKLGMLLLMTKFASL